LFSFADHLDARYQAARGMVDNIVPALLAKAFRGELVTQDPNDEPVSVMLERIRAGREAADLKPRKHIRGVNSN
jgi:type I restriction enzyme S subunit